MEGKGGGTIERALPIDDPIEYSIGWPEVENHTTDGNGVGPTCKSSGRASERGRRLACKNLGIVREECDSGRKCQRTSKAVAVTWDAQRRSQITSWTLRGHR